MVWHGRGCESVIPVDDADDLVAILRIAPAKADPSILQLEQSSIGYGHPVCVSGQILEHWLWSPERGLGVNDPLLLGEGREEVSEADRVGELANSPVEFETVCGTRLFQISEELAAE